MIPVQAWSDGTPENNYQDGTQLKAGIFESWNRELVAVIQTMGDAPDEAKFDQLVNAIKKIAWGGTGAARPTTLAGWGITDALAAVRNQVLGPDADWNSVIDRGMYAVAGETVGLNGPPTSGYGTLIVIEIDDGNHIGQLFLAHQLGHVAYRGGWGGGAWSAWHRLDVANWADIQNRPNTVAGYGITDAGSGKIIASLFTATRAVVAASGDTTVMTLNFTLTQATPAVVDWRAWFGDNSGSIVFGDARLMLGATQKSRSSRIHLGYGAAGYAYTYPFNGSTYLGVLAAGSYTISIIWNNQTPGTAVFNPGPADASVWSQADSEIIVRAAY